MLTITSAQYTIHRHDKDEHDDECGLNIVNSEDVGTYNNSTVCMEKQIVHCI